MYENGWLVTWKEIARYLHRSVRTAKRYYYKFSLPIRHDPGGRVVALKHEIDTWRVEFDNRKKKKRRAYLERPNHLSLK